MQRPTKLAESICTADAIFVDPKYRDALIVDLAQHGAALLDFRVETGLHILVDQDNV